VPMESKTPRLDGFEVLAPQPKAPVPSELVPRRGRQYRLGPDTNAGAKGARRNNGSRRG
jgi:hypothetical protein